MSFKATLLNALLVIAIGHGPSVFAQQKESARLTLHFINNIDSEVSIQQMKNPGSGLQFNSLMARIDSATGMAHFEFDIDRLTDYYWLSKVNQLGGQISLAPGDDLIMRIDKAEGYGSLTYEGAGAARNNFSQSLLHEHQAVNEKIFYEAEAGKISYSEVINRKMALLESTLQKIEARASLNSENQSLKSFAEKVKVALTYSTYQEMFYYISWFRMKLTEEDRAFLQSLDVDNEAAATSSREYLDFTSQYFFYQYQINRKKNDTLTQHDFAQTLYKGATLEAWKASRLVGKMQRGYMNSEASLDSLKAEFESEALKNDLDLAMYNFRQSQISDYDAGTQFIEGDFGSVRDLLALFRGKVIYIDFWGSWCGPCISSLPNNLRTQKEFSGKDVVFLFLAGNDLEKYWLRAIKKNQISGQHYLMSDEMLAEANELFDIEGFPSYSLVDKEGNIADNMPGKYANRELFDKIEALLEK